MADDSFPFPLAQGRPPVLPSGVLDVQGDRFTRMAAEEINFERGVSDRGQSRSSRGTADTRVRLDATRLAHQARSWEDLLFLIRREFHSKAVSGPEDAKLFIDIATSAYGAERGDSESAWFYALSLQKEFDEKAAAARQQQIGIRAQQLRDDPILRANLAWQDRVRKLADETGVDYKFAAEFVKEYDRLSMPRLPDVMVTDPRGIPFIQAEVPLYASAYLVKNYILPFTGAGALLGVYEGVTGKDILTGERLPMWERVLNIVTSLLPFVGGALKGGVKAVAKGIKLVVQELAAGAKAMAGLAVRIGRGARAMLRFAAKLAKLPAAKVQALLDRVTAARRVSQGLRLASDEVRLAGEVDEAIRQLDVVEAGARPRSMTATGVIDDGRALTGTKSGTIGAKPTPRPAAPGGGTVKALSKAATSLVSAGYLPQAVQALEKMGIKVTAKVAQSLNALGTTGRDFLNLFYESKGFHRVVGDLLKGGSKKIGAEFVMRFATRHPDILAKVRANALNVAFEWGAGIKKTRRFGDIFAREIDIVVRGDAAIGEGNTIYNELKSWTEDTLRASKGKKLPQQLVRDTALLDPHNIRWVFDASKMGDKGKIIKVFVELIQRDAYLTKAWGTDRAAITAALDRVVMVF